MRYLPALLLLACAAACGNGLENTAAAPAGPGPAPAPAPAPGPGPAPAPGDTETVRVFTIDNNLDSVRELVGINDDGRRVNLAPGLGSVEIVAIAPDGGEAAFYVEADGLYLVNGGDPLRVSPDGVLFAVLEMAWSPDGAKLAVIAEADGAAPQLYVVHFDGTGFQALTAATGGLVWTPDAARVLFRSNRTDAEQNELYSILCDGAGLAQLSQTAAAPGTLRFVTFSVSPSENCVAFRSDPDAAGDFQLYVRDASGATPAVRVSNFAGAEGTFGWIWSPNGQRLAYLRRVTATGFNAVFRVNKDGTDEREVSGVRDESVRVYAWAGDRIVYRDSDSLHSTDGDSIVDIVVGAAIRTFSVSPRGTHVGYLAGSVSRPDLFVAPVDSNAPVLVVEEVREFGWQPESALAADIAPVGSYTQPTGPATGTFDGGGTLLAGALAPRRASSVNVDPVDATPLAEIPMGTANSMAVLTDEQWHLIGLAAIPLGSFAFPRLDPTDSGYSERGEVLGANGNLKFRRDFHLFLDGDDIFIIAVNPQLVVSGATNFFVGVANNPPGLSDDQIQGVGFPATGRISLLDRVLAGTMDFQDGNGVFDFCTGAYNLVPLEVGARVTVREAPSGFADGFESVPFRMRMQPLARTAAGDWIKVRVLERTQFSVPVERWVARADLEANATWKGDLDKLEVE